MTEAFNDSWQGEPTKKSVEDTAIGYTTVCPVCFCSVMATDFMEKHLEWHQILQDALSDGGNRGQADG